MGELLSTPAARLQTENQQGVLIRADVSPFGFLPRGKVSVTVETSSRVSAGQTEMEAKF